MNRVNLICACGVQSSHQCSANWNGLNVADSAWHSVWLHGDWRTVTRAMSAAERSHAADAVARHSRQLALKGGNLSHSEPPGLRWWLDQPDSDTSEEPTCGFIHNRWLDGTYRERRRCIAKAGHTTGQLASDHGPWESAR